MKLFSLENDFQTASAEQKKSTIVRDSFDLLVAFLRGKYSVDELKAAVGQLDELGVLSSQEILGLMKQKAYKEGCETSVGKGPTDLKALWDRVAIIENL